MSFKLGAARCDAEKLAASAAAPQRSFHSKLVNSLMAPEEIAWKSRFGERTIYRLNCQWLNHRGGKKKTLGVSHRLQSISNMLICFGSDLVTQIPHRKLKCEVNLICWPDFGQPVCPFAV